MPVSWFELQPAVPLRRKSWLFPLVYWKVFTPRLVQVGMPST